MGDPSWDKLHEALEALRREKRAALAEVADLRRQLAALRRTVDLTLLDAQLALSVVRANHAELAPASYSPDLYEEVERLLGRARALAGE